MPERKIPDCANRAEKVTLTVGNTSPWAGAALHMPEGKIPDCANRDEEVTLAVGNTSPWAGALAPAFIDLLPESRGNGTGCLEVLPP